MSIFNTKYFDGILDFIERNYYIFLMAILLMSALNIFYNTGNAPINSWDEARHGVNAYEMIKRNNYIVNTYSYKNDYWNLKPPISYWAIIMGYKLMGFNPSGLRIVLSVSAYVTILMVAFFTLYEHGRLASLISTAALSSTVPYILEHCARTGDPDSIFVLFFTAAVMAAAFLERKIIYLYAVGISFALAFLTKSWHAGCIMIIYVIYIAASGIIFKLKLRHIILFILSACLPVIIWGFLRYSQDGFDFFKGMIGYDLMARTSRTLEGHVGDKSYYIDVLLGSYNYWLLILVGTLLAAAGLLRPEKIDKNRRNYYLLIFLWIAVPLALYSTAKTKIAWYILPVYPAMAISIGAASNLLLRCKSRNVILQAVILIMIIFSSYKNEAFIIKNISSPKMEEAQMLFKGFGKQLQYRGRRIYIQHFEQSYWLSAELYGDLIPADGGIEGFLKDDRDSPLLFITKDRKEMQEIKKYNFKIVAENEEACIFTKVK